MAQVPRTLDPTLSACHRFGAALRNWRQVHRLSQAKLAGVLPVTADQIAKYEKAHRWPGRRAVDQLDAYLRARGELVALWVDGEAERAAAPASRAPADPSYVAHWTQMLSVLAAAGNAVGGRGLLDVVSTEVGVISRYGSSATGQVAAGYMRVQARWLEFGSWIADNRGDRVKATAWLQQASELAGRARDPVLGAYVLMRRAQRAYEHGEARVSLDLLGSVVQTSQPPHIRALLATRAAQAHAALGDGRAMRLHLQLALGDAARDYEPADIELAPHATPSYVLAHEGMCLQALEKPNDAAGILEAVLRDWPAAQRLDEGLVRASLALAHVQAGAFDEGIHQARHALVLGVETGSRRTLRVVRKVLDCNLNGASGYEALVDQWTAAIERGT